MPLLARSARGVLHRIVSVRSTKRRPDGISYAVNRQPLSAPQVDGFSVALRILKRPDPPVNDVADIDEIARLLAIAENSDSLTPQQVPQKDSQHALVRVVQRLPRAVYIVHAKRGYL